VVTCDQESGEEDVQGTQKLPARSVALTKIVPESVIAATAATVLEMVSSEAEFSKSVRLSEAS
jgi:hypothetical protein